MSRNDLSVEEMLQICNNWLDETSPANAVLRKHPELKLMIPKIQSVVSALSLVTSGNKPMLAALVDKAYSLDADHDRIVRGLFGCFNGLIELEGDSDITNLRDWMFPDGLSHTTASYQAEAGHASKIQSEMTSDKKKLLQAIKLHGSTALDYVNQWFRCRERARDDRAAARGRPAADRFGQRAQGFLSGRPGHREHRGLAHIGQIRDASAARRAAIGVEKIKEGEVGHATCTHAARPRPHAGSDADACTESDDE